MSSMSSSQGQDSEGFSAVKVLAVVLERLVGANSHLSEGEKGQVTKFHAQRAPVIGIGPYLERIHKYASCSNECFILALIYIDRLIQRNNFLLTELNVHRVVITAVLLAAKFFDDAYYNNAYYAKVGGVLVSELNSLEVEFLFRINFSLRVAPDVFEKYCAELSSHAQAMGLQAPQHQFDASLQGYPEVGSSNPEGLAASLYEPDSLSDSYVHVQSPSYEAPIAPEAMYYQPPQLGVNCNMTSQQNGQNPPHITPSPPPHPPHVQGSISYASDLSQAMYETYPTTQHQAPPVYYSHQLSVEANTVSSNDSLLSSWPQVNISASPNTLHYQERRCSQSHQGHVVSQHPNYDYTNEWQMPTQMDYSGQNFVSSPSNQYVVKG